MADCLTNKKLICYRSAFYLQDNASLLSILDLSFPGRHSTNSVLHDIGSIML